MINGKRAVVVMPAFNAENTLMKTFQEVPKHIVDEIILVDDDSRDRTVEIAQKLNLKTFVHLKNKGYGANQKTCYTAALAAGADIVVMLHPDYQYTPKLITALASLIAEGLFDCVLGSRILGVGALRGGMPRYKYVANRILTFIQNLIMGYKLSEYHTGYRAFSKEVLESLPWKNNSDDFVFDNQILAQIIYAGYKVGEISCPTRYMDDSSSIGFWNSIIYGLGVLQTALMFRLHRWRLLRSPLFNNIPRPTDQSNIHLNRSS
ncbi:MAG: glycosyltransferase family 2 protein [Spirochaetota bacterium]